MRNRRRISTKLLLFLAIAFLGQPTFTAICYDFSVKKPAIGEKKVAVIAVQFPDTPASSTIDYLRHRVFVEMNNYYQIVSYGKLNITGDFVSTWINMAHNMSHYGNYNGTNNHSEGARHLIADALENSEGCMNFSQFDCVIIIHAGKDEAISNLTDNIWSYGFWEGLEASTNDGHIFNQGAVVSEFDEVGMYCHEFGHILGLPDLYNTNSNSSKPHFMGKWDLMDAGNYNGDPQGANPAQISSWGKIFLEWIEDSQVALNRLDTAKNFTLEPLETNSEGIKAINISIAPKLYYLIEARVGDNLPDQGVLMTFVNETRDSGEGIVEVIGSENSTQTLDDAALHAGDYFEETQYRFTVRVLTFDNSSYVVEVSNKLIPRINVTMPSEIEAYQEARIVNFNATPLQGLATTLFINGEKHQTLITDSNGTVVYFLSPFSLCAIGTKSVTIRVNGGEYFMDSQFDQILDVIIPRWFIPSIIGAISLLLIAFFYFKPRKDRRLSYSKHQSQR